ncbi:hypothetical protein BYT27DRAFT_7226042 [Phlegmacium glaucopus]|nr:hypothetical protein BYT27DRAFT_7226042 [Phlegmacium glaucopus]
MEQPPQQPIDRTKPWSSSALVPTPSSVFSLEEDDDKDDERKRKKATRFDDDHLTEIETKYAAGNCDIHPDKECFHHRPTDNHFELTRARKIFWAAKIWDGKASILVPPLSSNLFNPKSATKVRKIPSTPIESTVQPVLVPAHPPMTPTHPHMAGYPYMYPPYGYSPPLPAPFHMYSPSMFQPPQPPSFYSPGPSSHMKKPRSSPPHSSPPPAGGSVDAFCEQYKLKDSVCSGLKELGFEIGDDLSSVKDYQWEHVGIPPLTTLASSNFMGSTRYSCGMLSHLW